MSTVDEHSIEQNLNTWSQRGWQFDGIQFAMRESSKRPVMAFLLFTRQGAAEVSAEGLDDTSAHVGPDPDAARWKLSRMAAEDSSGGEL